MNAADGEEVAVGARTARAVNAAQSA